MKLYDAHTHLNGEELYPQREDHLAKFVQAGGIGLVNSGASDAYNMKGIEIARSALNVKRGTGDVLFVKATIGYHPGCCDDGEITQENIQKKIAELKSLYQANKDVVVAIGECGIDTYYPGSEDHLDLQKKLFAMQCDLAKELNLPLIVHIRKDFQTALEILKKYSDMTIYIHCRGFGPEEVERLRVEGGELGWNLFIGFCGNVTYKNAQNLRDSLAKVPLNQLLLETDAPRLSPQVVRGTTNTPANVKYIYEFVAEQRNIAIEDLSSQLEKNVRMLYKI